MQYPDAPGAQAPQALVEEYIAKVDGLAQRFVHLVAECLALPTDTFDAFKGQMSRLKFVKYPRSAPNSQGVGPHKDSAGLLTFLSQDNTGGLQVLNKNGEWIDVPPIEGSLVINIQQGFEAITGGVCAATTHRVIVGNSHNVSDVPEHSSNSLVLLGPNFPNTIQHSIFPRSPPEPDIGATERVCCPHRSTHPCLRRSEKASGRRS